MKTRVTTSVTTVAISVALFVVFLIHQLTFSSIWTSSSSSSSTDSTTPTTTTLGKQIQEQKLKWQNIPPPTATQLPGPAAPPPPTATNTQSIQCDHSHLRYDLCSLKGFTVLNPTISTLFLIDPTESMPSKKLRIRPYPRKWENHTMSRIKQLTLTTTTTSSPHSQCEFHHNSPALVFSSGGYTGNTFHDFNDGFIPLYLTIRTIFLDQNVTLVIANCQEWWLIKYTELIQQLTPYPIINLHSERATHCFPSATVGLISHGYMTIDSKLLPHSDTFYDFRALIGRAYLHTKHHLSQPTTQKPRMVIVSRTGNVGRVIRNQVDVVKLAEKSGFEVVLFQPTKYTSMSDAFLLINSSHAMIGVHGAALTHFLFLRPGAVFIQVVPIGIDWLAETCFGKPTKDMGVDYMEYKIRVNESSLVEKYGRENQVLNDSDAISKNTFDDFKKIYLKSQDVVLDLVRVGRFFKKAYKKAKSFMDREG